MIYILDQRLHAQNVATDKSHKVLDDVVKSMLNSKLVEQLFKPQELYTPASMRQVFDRLAHSSIMRLSVASMDKLYDLMTMGFKVGVPRHSLTSASKSIYPALSHAAVSCLSCSN